jgi:hypothetical protein
MSETAELDAMVDAAAAVLGLRVAPEWRAAIRAHLAISLGHAHAVADFVLPDEIEPAPVFRA